MNHCPPLHFITTHLDLIIFLIIFKIETLTRTKMRYTLHPVDKIQHYDFVTKVISASNNTFMTSIPIRKSFDLPIFIFVTRSNIYGLHI